MKYGHCLVVINPHSTHSDQAVSQLTILQDYFPAKHVARLTLTKNDFTSSQRIAATLRALPASSLVIVIGGDGTINHIVSQLLTNKLTKKITILPLQAGNASDMAHMLHGRRAADLATILESGTAQQAYAMELHINDKRQFVLAYVSFGALASTMHRLDGVARDSRLLARFPSLALLVEGFHGMAGLYQAHKIDVELNDIHRQYYDITYVNGSRIAKVYHTPNQLTEPRYTRLIIKHKHPVLIGHIISLIQQFIWRRSRQCSDRLTFHEKVWMQVDGDVTQVPVGTVITVANDMRPYTVLRFIRK